MRSGLANAAAGAGNDCNPFHLISPIALAHHSFRCCTVDGIRRGATRLPSLGPALRPRPRRCNVDCGIALRAALARRRANPEAIALWKVADYSPAASAERSAARLRTVWGLGVRVQISALRPKNPLKIGIFGIFDFVRSIAIEERKRQNSRNRRGGTRKIPEVCFLSVLKSPGLKTSIRKGRLLSRPAYRGATRL